ncbi:MAG: hypothetical protein AAFZ18_30960 [Myxococcota bacterium]
MSLRRSFTKELAARHGSLTWVLFAALAGAPIMFLTVAWVLVEPAPGLLVPTTGPEPIPPFQVIAMSIIAAGAGILAFLIRAVIATPQRLTAQEVPTGTIQSLVPPESDDERRLAVSVGRWQTAFIVALALSESMAIMGFLLSFLARDLTYVLIGAGVAVALDIVFLRPDPTIYEKLIRQVRG